MTKAHENPQMKIRLSATLKELIEQSAKENNRTMNAEIVSRLEATFGVPKFGFSESFSGLADDFGLSEAQEARVREIFQEEMKRQVANDEK